MPVSAAPYLRLVKFSHSVFALPFALISAWLASGGVPSARVLAWVVVCAVAARTAAMAFNRWLDRDVDADNPRTRGRELPAGELTPRAVLGLVAVASLVFVAAAFALNPLCGRLSPAVLAWLLGYSFTKRFTWLSHLVLGVALGLAPLGAWLAVTGSFEGDLRPPLLLALAVTTWVAGFDLIYASQDAGFDAQRRLHSIPARFGVARALRVARLAHVGTAACLFALGGLAALGPLYWLALAACLALLVWQHRIVAPDDLSRVDVAFFTLNGWVGVLLFCGVALDLATGSGAA